VIDVAKALAAADPPRRVIAVPTTLSAAEMTSTHRLPAGVDPGVARVRPAVVVNDPALSASQPETERLRDLGVARATLPALAAEAAGRPELANTPPAAPERELRDLYEAAW
jgi:alcohol dehydrogenase class IV